MMFAGVNSTVPQSYRYAMMGQLPEVLCFVISEAASSGKKLSWSVWNSGDMTTVKLCWKPEALSSSRSVSPPPPRPNPPHCQGLPSAVNSKPKKRRSPSSKKWSNQRLWNFLAKKKGQGVKTAGAQESPSTLNDAHLPSSPQGHLEKPLVKAAERDANSNTQAVADVHSDLQSSIESYALPTSPVCHEKLELSREDGESLKDLLQGTENVVYEARDDTTGISL